MLSAIEERAITMDPEEAREQLEAYRSELHKRADAEYEGIAEGLEAIADGRRLVNVREAILAGGFDEDGLPRLAIARADRRRLFGSWGRNFRPVLTFDSNSPEGTRSFDSLIHQFTLSDEDIPEPARSGRWASERPAGWALVPIIPAKVRQETGLVASRDRDHHILFEVEQWTSLQRTEPDRDPYLLRHLGGDLYIILAAWDLTDLERAIMAGRREG